MSDPLIERRQLLRSVAKLLAEPLEGDAKERFLARAEERINRDCPAPGRQQMRSYLKSNLIS